MKISSLTTSVILTALILVASTMPVFAGEGGPHRRGPGDQHDFDFIGHFDQDNDGKVSQAEFEGPAEHFARLDQNQDGYIDEDEAPKCPPPPKDGDFIQRLDQDNDGMVSQAEFDGPPEHFSHLDQNQDGYIDADEAPKGPPPRMQTSRRQ